MNYKLELTFENGVKKNNLLTSHFFLNVIKRKQKRQQEKTAYQNYKVNTKTCKIELTFEKTAKKLPSGRQK